MDAARGTQLAARGQHSSRCGYPSAATIPTSARLTSAAVARCASRPLCCSARRQDKADAEVSDDAADTRRRSAKQPLAFGLKHIDDDIQPPSVSSAPAAQRQPQRRKYHKQGTSGQRPPRVGSGGTDWMQPEQRELSARVRAAQSPAELLDLLRTHSEALGSSTTSVCYVTLAKMDKSQLQAVPRLAKLGQHQAVNNQHTAQRTAPPNLGANDPSTGDSAARQAPGTELSDAQLVLQALQPFVARHAPTMALSYLAGVLWAAAKLLTYNTLRPWVIQFVPLVMDQLYARGAAQTTHTQAAHTDSHASEAPSADPLVAGDPRTVSNLIYSLALLGPSSPSSSERIAVWEWVKGEFVRLADTANEQDLCNVAYALALQGGEPGPVWQRTCAAVTARLAKPTAAQAFAAQGLANLGYALKKLGPGDPHVVPALHQLLCRTPPEHHTRHPVNAANVVWAAACSGLTDRQGWYTQRAALITPLCKDMDTQLLSMVLWAYATADVVSGPLLDTITGALAWRPAWSLRYQPLVLVNILYGLAKLGRYEAQLFVAYQPVARLQLDEMTPLDHRMLLWALGKFLDNYTSTNMLRYADMADHQLVNSLLDRIRPTLPHLSMHEVGTVAASLTMLTWYSVKINRAIAERLLQGNDTPSLSQLATLLWWFAKVVRLDDPSALPPTHTPTTPTTTQQQGTTQSHWVARTQRWLLHHLQDKIAHTHIQSGEQVKELTRCLWCCALVDPDSVHIIRDLTQLLAPHLLERHHVVNLCMVAQTVHGVCQLSSASDTDLVWIQEEPVRTLMARAVALYQQKAREAEPSAVQMQVYAELQHVSGVTARQLEVPAADGMIRVDVMVRYGDSDVAVEVDGPFHYAVNRQDVVLGDTRFRNRLLESHGHRLLSVRAAEYVALGTLQKRTQYLSELLWLTVSDPAGLGKKDKKMGARRRSPEMPVLPDASVARDQRRRRPSKAWKTEPIDTQRQRLLPPSQEASDNGDELGGPAQDSAQGSGSGASARVAHSEPSADQKAAQQAVTAARKAGLESRARIRATRERRWTGTHRKGQQGRGTPDMSGADVSGP